jgi:putative transposase
MRVFNGKLRDELLNREIFYSLKEGQVLIEQWRRHYNEVRPHSSLGATDHRRHKPLFPQKEIRQMKIYFIQLIRGY